jgi:hypothetical protein
MRVHARINRMAMFLPLKGAATTRALETSWKTVTALLRDALAVTKRVHDNQGKRLTTVSLRGQQDATVRAQPKIKRTTMPSSLNGHVASHALD